MTPVNWQLALTPDTWPLTPAHSYAHHRDRFDCLRLPDVVSRQLQRAPAARSPSAREPELPGGQHGQAPGRVRAEHRVYPGAVSYTHLRAHETRHDLVCRLL